MRDQIIQEYVDRARKGLFIPNCDDFTYYTEGAGDGARWNYADLNYGDYVVWAILRDYLFHRLTVHWHFYMEETGNDIEIRSGYRNPAKNDRVGGRPLSRHQYGDAADMRPLGVPWPNREQWEALVRAARRSLAAYWYPWESASKASHHADWRNLSPFTTMAQLASEEVGDCSAIPDPARLYVGDQGGEVSLGVVTYSSCEWKAFSESAWITVLQSGGLGEASLRLSIAENNSNEGRIGSINLDGRSVPIYQAGEPCSYFFGDAETNLSAQAESGFVEVLTGSGCTWQAGSNASWVNITTGGGGAGPGAIHFSVSANPSASPRVANISVNGSNHIIRQAGLVCNYTLDSYVGSAPATGSNGSVGMRVASGCTWNASADVSWITITSGASGAGDGQISYTVNPNSGTSSRSGRVTAGGVSHLVSQQGVSCSYSIAPTSHSASDAGGYLQSTVSATSGCSWTTMSNAAWLSVTPAAGSGSGVASIYAQTNLTTQTRSGTVVIGGTAVTVQQQGMACGASVSPTLSSASATGGGGNFTVTVNSGCGWNATPNTSWVRVTSGSSGTGSGNVNFVVDPNVGPARSTVISVGASTHTISQAAYTPPPASAFFDEFDTPALDGAKWSISVLTGLQDATVPVAPSNGRLEIGPLKTGTAGSHYNGVVSNRTFNLTDAFVTSRLVTAPAANTNADAMLSLAADGSNHYRMYVSGGKLKLERKSSGVKTLLGEITFSPTTHAFWRIRHRTSDDRVLFEAASADSEWTVLASEARQMSVAGLKIELKAGTWQSESSSPGTVAFDSVRFASYIQGIPPLDAVLFEDQFDLANLDPEKWAVQGVTESATGALPVGTTGGALVFGPASTQSGAHFSAVSSVATYNMDNAYAWVRSVSVPSAGTSGEMAYSLVRDTQNYYRIRLSGGMLRFEKRVAGVFAQVSSVTFDPAQHAYWSIKHSKLSDVVMFETAPVNGPWTVRATTPREMSVFRLRVELRAGTTTAETVGAMAFDEVKMARPPGSGTETLYFAESFGGTSLDTTHWVTQILSGTQDPSIPLGVSNGSLTIGPLLQNTSGAHYNGISTIDYFDMTGAYAYVNAVATPHSASTADMMFTLVVNGSNHYRIFVNGGWLVCEKKINNVKTVVGRVHFDPVRHAFWSIAHDQQLDEIRFETSEANGVWTTHGRITRELPVTGMRLELKAGTFQTESASPGTVRFDNVRVAKP